jgi:hypothetical protein
MTEETEDITEQYAFARPPTPTPTPATSKRRRDTQRENHASEIRKEKKNIERSRQPSPKTEPPPSNLPT